MEKLRFGLVGAGFWSPYQLSGWQELSGAECVAVADCDQGRAESLANRFNIDKVYDGAESMLADCQLDFIDIVTNVETHASIVGLAAAHSTAAICQKPMAPTLEQARGMAQTMHAAKVPLLIHENWRWQAPIRRLQEILQSEHLGQMFELA